MAFSIEEILGFVPLTAAVEAVKNGVPKVLPEPFYRRNPMHRIVGDKTRRINYSGTRKVARINPYGAPPRQIKHLPLESQDIRLLHTEETLAFSPELFMQLREFETYTAQVMAQKEAQRQVRNAATRQTNLEYSSTHVMLSQGKLFFDIDNNLLPTSTGADLTIDYGVPANNRNQLNGIISASWANAATNIPTQLNAIKAQALYTTGYPLKYALYGKNIMGYLLQNNFVKEYLRYQMGPDRAEYFLKSGQIPPGLFDLDWVPMQNAFFKDPSDATVEVWDGDLVTFAPDPTDPNVFGIYEGTTPVPKSFSVTGDLMAQYANIEQKSGMFGYGMMTLGPPMGLVGVYGDTFLPSLMNPASYFYADTTP